MRGGDGRSGELFSYVDLEKLVRSGNPLRAIREIANETLAALEADFAALYVLGRWYALLMLRWFRPARGE